MSGFISEFDITTVAATTTVANIALPTTGPATFYISNEGPATIQVGLTQSGTPTGNIAITADNSQIVQCANPERTPGSVYCWVKTIGNLGTTANVFITSGFEI